MQKEKLNKTWFIDIDGTIVYHQTNFSLDDIIEELGPDSLTVEKPIERSIKFLNNISINPISLFLLIILIKQKYSNYV